MAIGVSFKQECPSCEAQVTVRDAAMVGKKIECPKCKDKFIVKSPAKKKDDDDDAADDTMKMDGKANGKANGKPSAKTTPPPNKKPAKAPVEDEDDDEDESPKKAKADAKKGAKKGEDDAEEAEDKKAKGKKKKAKEEEEDEGDGKGKKKKAASSRFTMGIILGVVGLVVLGAAAYFILGNKGTSKGGVTKGPPAVIPDQPDPTEEKTKDPPKDNGQETPKDPGTRKVQPIDIASNTLHAELSNLLPNDTDHVTFIPLREVLDPASPLRDALFQTPGALRDDTLQSKLGFSLLSINELIRADNFGTSPWSFTVLGLTEPVDQNALMKALSLKPAPKIKAHTYYQAGPNPWFETLARVSVGVPLWLRQMQKQDKRTLYVHIHNPQTLIFADEAPMQAFLRADKHFKELSDKFAPAPETTPEPNPDPNAPPPKVEGEKNKLKRGVVQGGDTQAEAPKEAPKEATNPTEPPAEGEKPKPPPPPRFETYMTVRPALKAILDRMEARTPEFTDKPLFSSATDLERAKLTSAVPEFKNKMLWQPRQAWDVTLMLSERKPRLRTMGSSLMYKDSKVFRVRNELNCPVENDAKALQKELAEEVAVEVARFIDQFLGHKVEVPKKEEPMVIDPNNPAPAPMQVNPEGQPKDPNNPEMPPPPEELPTASKITVTQKEKTVEFTIDLVPDNALVGRLHGMTQLIGSGLRASMDVAAGYGSRHELAKALKVMPEKGLTDRNVPVGQYPPGVFKRGPDTNRLGREPMHRVSFMAGLLPFLGHETLYQKINFEASWRDPVNWVPASTAVPQFLDPAYPLSSQYVTRPELPFELAATHFVGLAGVGLDAADYNPADPATIIKRGVFGYEQGITLDEIRQGHGLSNTIVMIQVPHDSIAGVTPWMAGGGSTVRGVPEKNSVAPFVWSTTGADGKPRRGTYALMADGSVRFIDESIADDAFKALATAKSPLPDNFDLDGPDSKTPKVKAPGTSSDKKEAAPVKKETAAPKQKPPVEKKAAPKSDPDDVSWNAAPREERVVRARSLSFTALPERDA